jgi:hypothetical protein
MRELIRHILKEQPQLDEIDKKLYNFLIRRLKKETIQMGGSDYGFDFEPISFDSYTFEGLSGWGFNTYKSKKYIEKQIIDMLWEYDIIDSHPYELDERDPKRVKIIKTIRHFLNHIL